AQSFRFPSRQRLVNRLDSPKILRNGRQRFAFLSVQVVANANFDFIQRVEDVEFRQRHRSEAVDLRRVARGKSIEPAATTWSSGGGAILATAFTDQLSEFTFAFEHLCGERTFANASRVRSNDSQHAI